MIFVRDEAKLPCSSQIQVFMVVGLLWFGRNKPKNHIDSGVFLVLREYGAVKNSLFLLLLICLFCFVITAWLCCKRIRVQELGVMKICLL